MPLPAIFTRKFYEQVFENRNRNYGAYVLRRSYSRTVILSLSLTCAILLLFAFGTKWFTPVTKAREADEAVKKHVTVQFPADQYKVVEMHTAPDTAGNTTSRVSANSQTQQVKTENKKQNPPAASVSNADVAPVAGASAAQTASPDIDYQGITEYLLEHVEYPVACKQEKTEGLVTVSFYVEDDGTLSRPRITQSDDQRMSEAVLKAFREMPNCKASKTSESKLMCRLPVRFSLNK